MWTISLRRRNEAVKSGRKLTTRLRGCKGTRVKGSAACDWGVRALNNQSTHRWQAHSQVWHTAVVDVKAVAGARVTHAEPKDLRSVSKHRATKRLTAEAARTLGHQVISPEAHSPRRGCCRD
jgi:hypothetical protein